MQDLEPDAFMLLSASASCMWRIRVVTGDALLYSSLLCRQDTYSDSMTRRNASLNLKRRNGGSHLYPTRLEPRPLLVVEDRVSLFQRCRHKETLLRAAITDVVVSQLPLASGLSYSSWNLALENRQLAILGQYPLSKVDRQYCG